ncbi:MAG: poly-gamma-glutamate synthase PgsB [Dethiobacter sp.]|nr:poly-gamma-glutamate synthase PgsB [Dethiobacter sp.]
MNLAALFLCSLPTAAIALGLREKHHVSRQVAAIKYRVNVNGTRGKSTVTRLLTAALLEGGIPTVGKATGSKSCILSFSSLEGGLAAEEKELIRRPEGANIKEVKLAIREASLKKAQALVAECMAVNPDYQKTFSLDYLKSNITILTNVLEDHMEILGPSLQDAADSFMSAVPANSLLIVCPGDYLNYFRKAASLKQVELRIADPSGVPLEYCGKFPFPVFPENVSLALEASRALGVKEEVALAGMLKALPDAGNLCYQKIKGKSGEGVLINAFSANDPTTTMAIWHYLKERRQVSESATVLMNCRSDRFERGVAFAKGVLKNIPGKSLILIGEGTRFILSRQTSLPYQDVVDLGGVPASKVALFLRERCREEDVFFGIGNYFGIDKLRKELEGG